MATTSDQVLINLQGIQKVFYTDEVETHALQDVHLDIRKGEYIAISGPSGCGKTTLLSLLGLLDSPTSGEYLLEGQPVAKLDPAERARVRNRQIGFIFQAFNLIGDLTVYENVELPLTYRGLERGGAEGAGAERAREGGDVAPREALSGAALGRPAAARRRGARRGRRSGDPPGRRADG